MTSCIKVIIESLIKYYNMNQDIYLTYNTDFH